MATTTTRQPTDETCHYCRRAIWKARDKQWYHRHNGSRACRFVNTAAGVPNNLATPRAVTR